MATLRETLEAQAGEIHELSEQIVELQGQLAAKPADDARDAELKHRGEALAKLAELLGLNDLAIARDWNEPGAYDWPDRICAGAQALLDEFNAKAAK